MALYAESERNGAELSRVSVPLLYLGGFLLLQVLAPGAGRALPVAVVAALPLMAKAIRPAAGHPPFPIGSPRRSARELVLAGVSPHVYVRAAWAFGLSRRRFAVARAAAWWSAGVLPAAALLFPAERVPLWFLCFAAWFAGDGVATLRHYPHAALPGLADAARDLRETLAFARNPLRRLARFLGRTFQVVALGAVLAALALGLFAAAVAADLPFRFPHGERAWRFLAATASMALGAGAAHARGVWIRRRANELYDAAVADTEAALALLSEADLAPDSDARRR